MLEKFRANVLKSARIVDLFGKLSGVADFENTSIRALSFHRRLINASLFLFTFRWQGKSEVAVSRLNY